MSNQNSDQDLNNQETQSNHSVEQEYDDAQAEEQIDNFFEQVEQDEDQEAYEFDIYYQRHQIGFDDYEKYANHMIKHDKTIAYRLGIAKKFCKYCRRLFSTHKGRTFIQLNVGFIEILSTISLESGRNSAKISRTS
ncbi:hypothetical protein ABPG72_015932 [Tetrahymena utriculariae]